MKKNNMLRIASVLLVAVLLSTCAISGAFAKYVTGPAGIDETARVARFGITLDATTANTAGLFAKTYAKDSTTAIALTVDSDELVVAPGTTKTLADYIDVTESDREVAVKVEYAATVTLTGWEVAGAEYCPIEITVDDETFKIGANSIEDIEDLTGAVAAKVATYGGEYDVDTTIAGKEPAITWNWAFEGDNTKDTVLGEAGSATIQITVTATVTQIN